jgi:hypothetical protein
MELSIPVMNLKLHFDAFSLREYKMYIFCGREQDIRNFIFKTQNYI